MTHSPMLSEQPREREEERAAIVAWLRQEVASECLRMTLAAAMPGGTRTERNKLQGFVRGCTHATATIADAIERGDYPSPPRHRPAKDTDRE